MNNEHVPYSGHGHIKVALICPLFRCLSFVVLWLLEGRVAWSVGGCVKKLFFRLSSESLPLLLQLPFQYVYVSVCVRERERKKQCACVCVCVCV